MDKQEALEAMCKYHRAIIAPALANEIRAAWGLKPMKGVKASTLGGYVRDPDALAVSMDQVALSIATKLECPEFENPMLGRGSAAEWDTYGCCVQIAVKEGLNILGQIYPGLAAALRKAGTEVPDEWVEVGGGV